MSRKTDISVSEWAELIGSYETIPSGFKSLAAIAKETGLCRMTVTSRMQDLVRAGRVEEMKTLVRGHYVKLYRRVH